MMNHLKRAKLVEILASYHETVYIDQRCHVRRALELSVLSVKEMMTCKHLERAYVEVLVLMKNHVAWCQIQ